MMKHYPIYTSVALYLLFTFAVFGQDQTTTKNYLDLRWKEVATKMPEDWYGTSAAQLVAENVLLNQKDIGGWAKNKPYHHEFTEKEKQEFLESKTKEGATFDNGATIMEMIFLSQVYAHTKSEKYKAAFLKGLDYIFVSQYPNGGWPQFYPFRHGKSVSYAADITYNDDAMVNILKLLRDLVYKKENYLDLQLSDIYLQKASQALDKGIDCILKTQIVVNGKPTVWCAQHDPVSLAPSNARKFELASFSGAESEEIVQFLMSLRKPSKDVVKAVDAAVKWFEDHKIEGIKLERQTDSNGTKDVVVVKDSTAPPLWARFYDLETEKPFFCDRDGIKKNTLAEIGYERRNGYAWYTADPSKVLSKYPDWKEKLKAD